MMTKEELIELAKKRKKDTFEYIDTNDERILEAYEEYDWQVEKIIEADLSMHDLMECFGSLTNLYHQKYEDAKYIPELDKLANFYMDVVWDAGDVVLSATDLVASLKLAEEVVKRMEELGIELEMDLEPWETVWEQEKESITMLESLIGLQPEFNTIMDR